MALAVLNPGILIVKKLSTEIAELEELALYSSMCAFVVSIPLLIETFPVVGFFPKLATPIVLFRAVHSLRYNLWACWATSIFR